MLQTLDFVKFDCHKYHRYRRRVGELGYGYLRLNTQSRNLRKIRLCRLCQFALIPRFFSLHQTTIFLFSRQKWSTKFNWVAVLRYCQFFITMSKLRPPEALAFDDQHSLADQWRMWAQEMRLYLELVMSKNTEKEKCSAFLYIIGRKGREIYNTWTLNKETEKDKIEVLFQKIQLYCEPKKNIILARYRFNQSCAD